jgi:hypothetical protein
MPESVPELIDYARADAVLQALNAAAPEPHEMAAMLMYLCGYTPDGMLAALELIRKSRG